ncbi:MAG: hypothetical protein U9M95_01105 [Candidatus Altiarchaeota archaeon]|nr:hypothetical protein [Candidatus Altiarchaeota archaeon]
MNKKVLVYGMVLMSIFALGLTSASAQTLTVKANSSDGQDDEINGLLAEDVTVRVTATGGGNANDVVVTLQYCGVNSKNDTSLDTGAGSSVTFKGVKANKGCNIKVTATKTTYAVGVCYINVPKSGSRNHYMDVDVSSTIVGEDVVVTVTDRDSEKSLEAVMVQVYLGSEYWKNRVEKLWTDEDGQVTFTLEEAGRYILTFEKSDYVATEKAVDFTGETTTTTTTSVTTTTLEPATTTTLEPATTTTLEPATTTTLEPATTTTLEPATTTTLEPATTTTQADGGGDNTMLLLGIVGVVVVIVVVYFVAMRGGSGE